MDGGIRNLHVPEMGVVHYGVKVGEDTDHPADAIDIDECGSLPEITGDVFAPFCLFTPAIIIFMWLIYSLKGMSYPQVILI